MTEQQTDNRPSMIAWQVTGAGEASRWTRIGAAWPHRDGRGYGLVLDAVPLTGRVVIRAPEPRDDAPAD